jgi:hypothetical protein
MQCERRACEFNGMDRRGYRYEPEPDRDAQLRTKLTELARQKLWYGYRRLGVLLAREGAAVNHTIAARSEAPMELAEAKADSGEPYPARAHPNREPASPRADSVEIIAPNPKREFLEDGWNAIARGGTSVPDLAHRLRKYIRADGKSAKPFRWTYTDSNRRVRPVATI